MCGCRLLSEPCVDLLNKIMQEMLADLGALKEAGVDAPEALTLMAKLAMELCAPNLTRLEPYIRPLTHLLMLRVTDSMRLHTA